MKIPQIQLNNNITADDCFYLYPPKTSLSPLNQLSAILYENSFKNRSQIDLTPHDDSLTSLNWLNNINISIPTENSSIDDRITQNNRFPNNQNQSNINLNHYFPLKLQSALRNEGLFDSLVRYEYKSSWTSKPPFSYTTLICMAMLELQKPKIALYEIYEWIRENFLFYRISDSSWQNSVRHNLSLKKCFEKVPRRKDERGKGGFWRINANYTDNLGTNLIKYRRQFQIYASPQNSFPRDSKEFSYQKNSLISDSNTADDFTAFSKRYSSISNNVCSKNTTHKLRAVSTKPIFKKPITLSSLNQYQTFEDNDKVTSQIRLQDSPHNTSPSHFSFTEETLFSDISPADSLYSNFGLEDFESTTSSSFDTDLSCNSNLHSSSDDNNRFHSFPSLDFEHFTPNFL